jgi:hypothetical protein
MTFYARKSHSHILYLSFFTYSARLAVDVAHDRLETSSKVQINRNHSAIIVTDELDIIGPCLDTPTALAAAYYTLASQLDKNGFLYHAIDWYSRSYDTAVKFNLDSATQVMHTYLPTHLLTYLIL